MPFQPVILVTDAMFFLLTIAIIIFVFVAKNRLHLRRPWVEVLTRTTGVVSLVVILFYYSIALLDSFHFHPRLKQSVENEHQYSNEILSVLDVLMSPMRKQVEKTFSAPLATQYLAKEMVQHDDGSVDLEYKRLTYGGAHIANPTEGKRADLGVLMLKAVVVALVVWAFVWMLIASSMRKKWALNIGQCAHKIIRNETVIPLRAVAITSGLLILLVTIAAFVGTKYHLFGTDKVGHDVLYQAIKSVRTGILIGSLTTLVMLPLAITLGAMAGYFKGWVDDVIQYIYTTLNSIPNVLLIAAAILLLQVYMSNNADSFDSLTARADLRLLFLCLILGITSWTGLCRLLRAETFKLREMEYIQAARAMGLKNIAILSRHVMPNFMHIVIISVAIDFSGLVLAEAVLSYINIGVDPTMNSWGNMINQARLEMAREPVVWWSLAAAFVFMFTLVLFANLFADVVRDALDPRVSNASEK